MVCALHNRTTTARTPQEVPCRSGLESRVDQPSQPEGKTDGWHEQKPFEDMFVPTGKTILDTMDRVAR